MGAVADNGLAGLLIRQHLAKRTKVRDQYVPLFDPRRVKEVVFTYDYFRLHGIETTDDHVVGEVFSHVLEVVSKTIATYYVYKPAIDPKKQESTPPPPEFNINLIDTMAKEWLMVCFIDTLSKSLEFDLQALSMCFFTSDAREAMFPMKRFFGKGLSADIEWITHGGGQHTLEGYSKYLVLKKRFKEYHRQNPMPTESAFLPKNDFTHPSKWFVKGAKAGDTTWLKTAIDSWKKTMIPMFGERITVKDNIRFNDYMLVCFSHMPWGNVLVIDPKVKKPSKSPNADDDQIKKRIEMFKCDICEDQESFNILYEALLANDNLKEKADTILFPESMQQEERMQILENVSRKKMKTHDGDSAASKPDVLNWFLEPAGSGGTLRSRVHSSSWSLSPSEHAHFLHGILGAFKAQGVQETAKNLAVYIGCGCDEKEIDSIQKATQEPNKKSRAVTHEPNESETILIRLLYLRYPHLGVLEVHEVTGVDPVAITTMELGMFTLDNELVKNVVHKTLSRLWFERQRWSVTSITHFRDEQKLTVLMLECLHFFYSRTTPLKMCEIVARSGIDAETVWEYEYMVLGERLFQRNKYWGELSHFIERQLSHFIDRQTTGNYWNIGSVLETTKDLATQYADLDDSIADPFEMAKKCSACRPLGSSDGLDNYHVRPLLRLEEQVFSLYHVGNNTMRWPKSREEVVKLIQRGIPRWLATVGAKE